MKAYLFDEHTKEYIGEVEAQIDPLESQKAGKNIWLLPANATFEKPLEKEYGKAAIFNGNTWQLVDDNRGKFTIKDGYMQEITDLNPVEKILTDAEVQGIENGKFIIVNNEVVEKPESTKEEQRQARAEAYRLEKDPITCQINSLRDEEQTDEIIAKIASLVEERKAKVEEIKARYPYPVE